MSHSSAVGARDRKLRKSQGTGEARGRGGGGEGGLGGGGGRFLSELACQQGQKDETGRREKERVEGETHRKERGMLGEMRDGDARRGADSDVAGGGKAGTRWNNG